MATLPSLREMIAALVAVRSVSSHDATLDSSNRGVVDLLAGWLEDLGFAIEIMPVSAERAKVNLIARRGDGDGGLVLAGHTDTVPCDAEQWHSDPFVLTERDGKLVGLGSADMKGFLALAVQAAQRAPQTRAPLTILATADEESGMTGARALVAAGRPRAAYAVIGEPTGLVPIRMHKGITMLRLTVHGQAGHSSDPANGLNAIEGMHAAISSLLAWRRDVLGARRDDHFAVPVSTTNLGRIRGGDNANRICGACELDLDLRFLPGVEVTELIAGLQGAVLHALAGSGMRVALTPMIEPIPAFATAPDAPLVRAAEKLTGAAAAAVAFGTEAPFLQALGCETIVLGPGDIAVAHSADEYVTWKQLRRAASIVDQLIARFCDG